MIVSHDAGFRPCVALGAAQSQLINLPTKVSRLTGAWSWSLALLTLILPAPSVFAQTWIELSATNVPPGIGNINSGMNGVYDSASNRLIVFGGGFTPRLNSVWVLSNANGLGGSPTWTQLATTGTPPSGRAHHTTVYDPTSNRIIVFAGANGSGDIGSLLNDVWVLTNANGLGGTATWTQLLPTGGPPIPRMGPAAIYDLASNRMTIFGGCFGSGFANCTGTLNDVWVLTNANGIGGMPAWIQLTPPSPPPPRRYPTGAYDQTSGRMIVFGGEAPLLNDTWVLTNAAGLAGPSTWSQVMPVGGPPPGRGLNSMTPRQTG